MHHSTRATGLLVFLHFLALPSLNSLLTHSLTHSLTYLLTHSLTHSLAYLLAYLLTYLLTDWLTHSLTLSLTHSLTHSHQQTYQETYWQVSLFFVTWPTTPNFIRNPLSNSFVSKFYVQAMAISILLGTASLMRVIHLSVFFWTNSRLELDWH